MRLLDSRKQLWHLVNGSASNYCESLILQDRSENVSRSARENMEFLPLLWQWLKVNGFSLRSINGANIPAHFSQRTEECTLEICTPAHNRLDGFCYWQSVIYLASITFSSFCFWDVLMKDIPWFTASSVQKMMANDEANADDEFSELFWIIIVHSNQHVHVIYCKSS